MGIIFDNLNRDFIEKKSTSLKLGEKLYIIKGSTNVDQKFSWRVSSNIDDYIDIFVNDREAQKHSLLSLRNGETMLEFFIPDQENREGKVL